MRERINKPKVFLSHSSLDKRFIDTFAQDLRRCHIDYWLDTEEIRDGRPWLKVIFEDGIPTCDAVIVYLTEASIASKMVEKEMDATFVEQLSESGIIVLPYVSREELRGRLRADIRALHCREWNEENYHSVLPTVVAEIWRSYTERIVSTVVLQEKNRRLVSELELKRVQERYEATVFTASEEREFSYLRQRLDRDIEVALGLYHQEKGKGVERKVGEEIYKTNLLSLLIYYVNDGAHTFRKSNIEFVLHEKLNKDFPSVTRPEGVKSHPFGSIRENVVLELQTYGLARVKEVETYDPAEHYCEFTDKMYRFKHWLEYNGVVPVVSLERVKVENVQKKESEEEDRELAYVAEIDEEVSFQDRRNKWRTSEEGVLDAKQQVRRLYDELERLVKLSNEKLTNIKVNITRRDENHCVISSRQQSLSVKWECNNPTSLENSQLLVEGYESKSEADVNSELTEQHRNYQTEHTINMQRDSVIVWRGKSENQALTSEELAARFLSYLLSSVRRSAVYKD
jgi:hypothetical protein